MKRILSSVIVLSLAMGGAAHAQQDELAAVKAELLKQQEIIAGLMKKVEELEKKQATVATRDDLERETHSQQERVNSMEEQLLRFVGRGHAAYPPGGLWTVGVPGLEHHVAALDLGQFFDQGSRGVA